MQPVENEQTHSSIRETIEDEFFAVPFSRLAGNEHYNAGGADALRHRRETIEAFLASETMTEPDVAPRKHDQATVDQAILKYETMLDILFSQPRSEDDEILIDKIIDKTGELFRYKELMLAFGSTAMLDKEKHERIASDLSMELVGGVNQKSFDTLFNELVELAEASQQPYAKELLDKVGRRPKQENGLDRIELKQETREKIAEDLVTLYPGLAELLRESHEGPVTPEDAVPIFTRLQEIAHLNEWRTELRSGKAAEAHSTEKLVTIGRERDNFKNFRDAVAVGLHESIVHANRSEGIVLPNAGDFEEGIATRLQQIISGEERTPGVQYYLSIGLQIGADQNEQLRSYRETFEILWRREALLMEKAGKPVDVAKARQLAQRQVQRTRRGGVVDTRDASYFIGAQKAAAWLNEVATLPAQERRAALAKVLTNRYDPTDPEQSAYIDRHA
jgi:hypothetical protein